MKIRALVLSSVLAVVLFVAACVVPPWVNTVENDAEIAVPIAASIVDLIDPALAPLDNAIVAGFNALIKVLDTYKASPTATNLQAVQAAVAAVNANVTQLEAAGQIHNPNTDAKITAIVGLLNQLMGTIVSQVPASAGNAKISLPTSVHNSGWFKGQYNALVKGDARFKQLQ